ncbi:MAG: Stk1 family PASTA domain-containing Ser/Thr kinase [Lachnospiraceae bacterium]|nr:Stk1 family PASTA domain-containing Ser/Thr kinase [Lachnospiraceae bacterium]
MIKIGMLIADRYEILEKVGTGGMADVYKSKDHTLNRYVAVKVLKQEFSENANFVSKFRVEAQAAAGLMHPNIVNVYDVGEEKGIYYIVMELVDGITLKNYIAKRGRLGYKEAVTIALQVSMGLEVAHRNHIIHRDIKPQNIIISRDGKVKVTDFGIAKAATSDTITSNVMGSVHYTSPEQARGGYSDEKSDVYSLGVTLYEMLTGEVPFDGETTVAIAIRHIQEPMPSPRKINPDIPYSVDQIVLKCCEKSPDRRYQNMQELAADLKMSISNPDGDFVKRYDPNDMGSTRMITDEEKEQIKQGVKNRQESVAAEADVEEDVIRRPTKVVKKVKEEVDFDDDDDDVEEQEHSMDRIAAILAILAVAIIGVILVMIIGGRTGILPGGANKSDKTAMAEEMVVMPNVVGIDASAARSALVKEGLIPELTYEESDKFTVGIVMRTSVEEGTQVPVGTTVVLTVCGNSGSKIPSVVGLTKDEAVDLLTEAGFNVNIAEASSEEVEAGYVISQDPEGDVQADGGSYVTITVSVGPDMTGKVEMPRILGMTEQEARNTLNAFGLKAGNVRTIIDSDPDNRGLVISQDVEPGTTIEEGTAVNFDIAGQQTYSYSADISAPTNSEDPDYKAGTSVHIVIVTEDGQKLLDTTTSAFPYRMGCTGITSEYGTLTMDYEVTIVETVEEEVPVTDGEISQEGNSGTAATDNDEGQGDTKKVTRTVERTEERTITRDLTFTPEN